MTLNISGNPREKKWWDHMARVMTKIFGASLYIPDEVGAADVNRIMDVPFGRCRQGGSG